MSLFQALSSGNVKEISLLYEFNEYFDIQSKQKKIEVVNSNKGQNKTRR